jgi:hypothetical protein
MQHTVKKVIFVGMSALFLLFAVGASAQEKKLKKSDLPPAVQKTADEQSRGATVKGYASEREDGKLLYEVELVVNGRTRDVTMSADGAIVEVEEEVDLKSLPPAVQQGLQKKAGAGKIGKVESLSKRGTLVAYEAHVLTGNKRSEVQVGPGGESLAHPE